MLTSLYRTCGRMPVIGQHITMAYLSMRIKQSVQKNKDRKLDPEVARLGGNELDGAIRDIANDIYEEELAPMIAETGIPSMLTDRLKNRAIRELSQVLVQQAEKAATTKTGAA